MKKSPWIASAVSVAALIAEIHAAPVIVDFESFSDSTPLESQIVGLTFNGAVVLTAGLSLNEFEFPPNSGSNVVSMQEAQSK